MMATLKELLEKPIARMEFPLHFSPHETQDPLKAIDEWLSGWGDRLDATICWDRFKSYSPFYKHRKAHEPEPYFYGGFPLSEVFALRYKQFQGFDRQAIKTQAEVAAVVVGFNNLNLGGIS